MQILSQLLGLSEYQDSKSGFGDIVAAIGGKVAGSATGGLGSALGGSGASKQNQGVPGSTWDGGNNPDGD
jgi:hypothetical protein